jgi:hypothetical protein
VQELSLDDGAMLPDARIQRGSFEGRGRERHVCRRRRARRRARDQRITS